MSAMTQPNPVPLTLVDLWDAAVERHGGAPAVEDENTTLTYAELDARAEAVGRQPR